MLHSRSRIGESEFGDLQHDGTRADWTRKIEAGALSAAEMARLEERCYEDLHQLRGELDVLLGELREFLHRLNGERTVRTAAA